MDREILFRGRRVDSREWATSVCPFGVMCCGTMTAGFIPDTVGQYTGLTDRRGVKIFEGDIIRQYREGSGNEYLYADRLEYGRVFWNPSVARYERTSRDFAERCFGIADHCEYEVIGNIHDNPELLEGGSHE